MLIELPSSEALPSDGDRWEFATREPEPETALRYHRARSHDPAIARWTAQDPVQFAAGDANLYRYVGCGTTEAGGGPGRSPS